MTDYKPNSNRFKEEQKQKESEEKKEIRKVVKGKVKTRTNGARKFKDVFISKDASDVKSYIFMDVLVPAIKKAVSDIVTDGINMVLYGDTKAKKRTNSTYVSYRDYSEPRETKRIDAKPSNAFNYDELVFESRGEAEAVLEQLKDMLGRYFTVSVMDLYESAGLVAPYTSNKYGWLDLRTAEVIRIRDGYIIKLPKAMPID